MRVGIQGHPTRGKEVIQILESLGGKNTKNWHGGGDILEGFFIDNDGIIRFDNLPIGYKLYTLEEFEKEFPFKVGDRVISTTTNYIGTITELKENGCYRVKYDNGNIAYTFGQNFKFHKEMKEKRNITLTLDKAKEWYKKGGELKEVALQAYSEKELNLLPRSWEEFATNYARMGYYISADGKPLMCAFSGKLSSPHVCRSIKSAEAHLAMIQLEQLRDCWRGDWKPNWQNSNERKYTIRICKDEFSVEILYVTHTFLSFPTYELALEFLECFRDLIKKAGDLI